MSRILECKKDCVGLSCPHWAECFPEPRNDIREQDKRIAELEAENKKLREALRGASTNTKLLMDVAEDLYVERGYSLTAIAVALDE